MQMDSRPISTRTKSRTTFSRTIQDTWKTWIQKCISRKLQENIYQSEQPAEINFLEKNTENREKTHRGKHTDQVAMTTTKAAVAEERSVITGIQNHADSFHLADAMMATSVYFHTEQQIHQQVLRSPDHNHQVPEQLRPRRRIWLWRRYSFRT